VVTKRIRWFEDSTGPKASDAVQVINSGIAAFRSTGSTTWIAWHLSFLTSAYAQLGQFDDAWRCVGEAMTAMETTKERWCEAEVNRVAGEIALLSPERDAARRKRISSAHFLSRQQQAKFWEPAMSMAQLWRDHGKLAEARDLLAPVYGWFTEGFDTLDLRRQRRCWTNYIKINQVVVKMADATITSASIVEY
jgi:predicted ATPase